jgi:hypothetical protein
LNLWGFTLETSLFYKLVSLLSTEGVKE